MDMRHVDNQIGIVRPLPRWAEATQRRSLEEACVKPVVVLTGANDDAVLGRVRKRETAGDVVHVYLLHVLANRDLRDTHPVTSLFWWVEHLVRRGAIIVETATGRRADTWELAGFLTLIEMLDEAVATVTRGTRGRRAAMMARENGAKSEGRTKFDPTHNRSHVEALHYAPPDKRITGNEYVERLRKLGWCRSKAFAILGPRGGR